MYKKNSTLNNYDVFPLVAAEGKETCIHIRPRGGRKIFTPGKKYTFEVCAIEGGNPKDFPASGDIKKVETVCTEEGGFDLTNVFTKEQEYRLRVTADNEKNVSFFIYCIKEDLFGRYPLMGDLHMHTYRSDGSEAPAVVAANYRRYGYDFTVISDHQRYYPSLEAIDAYKNVNTEMVIIPGEEVHLPAVNGLKNDIHIVNFGSEYSVNALIEGKALEEKGDNPKYRSLYGKCPPVIPYDEWQKMLQEKADSLKNLPADVDAVPYAVCCWIFDEIRKGNGLGIFAHPYWKITTYHSPEAFTDYMMETKPFDAFEVLGGENYFEQNGFQMIKYYEMAAKGVRIPVVGSTDSHSSYEQNENAFICETIVFAPKNERRSLVESVKDFYSVAVDTISTEYRIVGELRLVKYARFLLDNYFPIHDELCFEEGRLMKEYVTGTSEEREDAEKALNFNYGRMAKQRKKYFGF